MKRRRTMIVSLLLVAALALGVGYAAVAGDLLIHGDMTILETAPIDVKFISAVGEATPVIAPTDPGAETNLKVEVLTSPLDVDNGQMSISFKASNFKNAGDEVTLDYTIKNFSTDTDATIESVALTTDGSTNFTSEYFSVTYDDLSGQAINAEDTLSGSLTIHLNQAFHGDDDTNNAEIHEEYFVLTIKCVEAGA